jgi:alpha-2-macroglobulin
LTLDKAGTVRTSVSGLPKIDRPLEPLGEFEFRDPNGEVQTVSSRVPLWPAHWLVGIKPDSWTLSKETLKFQVAVTSLTGKPVPQAPVGVDLYERETYSHRKRLVGGFYAYEHSYEVKRVRKLCEGKTDQTGLLVCEATSPIPGNVILQASVKDEAGLETTVHRDVWVAGKNQQWFRASDDDRIDLLPEKKRYEAASLARLRFASPLGLGLTQAAAWLGLESGGSLSRTPLGTIPRYSTHAYNLDVLRHSDQDVLL